MRLLLSVLFFTLISSCQLSRFVFYNFAGIKDEKIFPSRKVLGSSSPFRFHPKTPKEYYRYSALDTLDSFLKNSKTVAFLVIRNDSILYENYWKGFDESSKVASFSMAKSVTSLLIGCAMEDGYIKSTQDLVIQYIPELAQKKGFEQMTLEHVLQMTTGIAFSENYFNPFSEVASFYYGTDLTKSVLKLEVEKTPGTEFKYISGNTQLLGFILHRALKDKTISQYLQEKLWTPMQMEYDVTWSLDKKNGLEKTFCCLNARARDFAKIGRLMLQEGSWNGQQLVPKEWIRQSTGLDTSNASPWFYEYQWWLPSKNGDFMAKGFLGQYIYVNPDKNLIMVRLGKMPGGIKWGDFFVSFSENL